MFHPLTQILSPTNYTYDIIGTDSAFPPNPKEISKIWGVEFWTLYFQWHKRSNNWNRKIQSQKEAFSVFSFHGKPCMKLSLSSFEFFIFYFNFWVANIFIHSQYAGHWKTKIWSKDDHFSRGIHDSSMGLKPIFLH